MAGGSLGKHINLLTIIITVHCHYQSDSIDSMLQQLQLHPQLFGIPAELCSPAAAVDVDLLVGAVEAGHQQPAHTNQPPNRARVEPDR